ncbi:hypothetical protein Trydic_g9325 [Trypoxylus dichotomus]
MQSGSLGLRSNTLGVILVSRVIWGAHIHRVLDRGRQMSETLYPLLIGRGKLDLSHKIRIYKTVLRSIATYASAYQNRILRMSLNASWRVRNITLHEDAGVELFIDFIRRIATRFFDRAITTSGSPGGTLDHGYSSWATRTDDRAPSLLITTQK